MILVRWWKNTRTSSLMKKVIKMTSLQTTEIQKHAIQIVIQHIVFICILTLIMSVWNLGRVVSFHISKKH